MFISYPNMLISSRGEGYAINPDLYNPCIGIKEEVSDINYGYVNIKSKNIGICHN
jgi:hypothetical protein